jgi:Brp/Blh family beta-carotene 15,15'-monooxygenase
MKPETTSGERWPERANRLQPAGAAVVMLLVAAIGALLGPLRLELQLAVLGGVIVLFGSPRLGRDPELGRLLLEAHAGASWRLALLVLLIGGAALVLLAWWLWPTPTLLVMVAVVALHVGRDAAEALGRADDPPIVAVFSGMPLVLPASFHPGEVGTVLAWVTLAPDPGAWIEALAGLGPPAAILWFTLAGLAAGRFLRRTGAIAPVGELVAGTILFALAPPLLALACYLAATDGTRGLLGLAEDLNPDDGRAAFIATVRRSIPLVGAALALVAFGLVVALLAGIAPEQALAIVPVWGFGAFALPHLVLEAFDPAGDHRGDDFFGPEMPLERLKDALRRTRRRVARDRPKRADQRTGRRST